MMFNRLPHRFYWLFIAIICIMVIVRNVVGIQFPIVLFLPVAFMLSLVCNKEEIVAFLCSMAPFENSFQYRYMILIGAFFLLLKGKRRRFSFFVPILLMMICEVLHFIGGGIGIASYLREFTVLIALGVVLVIEPLDYSDGLPIRSLAVVTLFVSFVTALVSKKLTGYSLLSGARLGSTYDVVESYNSLLNPNVGSFFCVLSICGLVLLIRSGNKRKADIPIILGLSMFVVLFQSKSALICMAVAGIIYLYANNRNWLIPTLRVLAIAFVLALLGIVFFRDTIMGFLARFTAEDFSTGRVGIFIFYHKYLFSDWKNIVIGQGLFDYAGRVLAQLPVGVAATSGAVTYVNNKMTLLVSHNNVQEIVIAWGIPGVVLVWWLLIKMKKHQKMKRNILHWIALCFILLYTLQGQLISSDVALSGLLLSLVCLEYRKSEDTYGLLCS